MTVLDKKHRRAFTWLFAGNAHTRMLEYGEYYTDVGLFQFLVGGDGHIYWIEGGYSMDVSQFNNSDKSTYPTLTWYATGGGKRYVFGSPEYYERIKHWKKIKTKWPHLKFFLTLRQDGSPAIFESLVKNYDNAQTKLANDIRTLMRDFDFADGMDYDFERLHGRATSVEVTAFARVLYNVAKERNFLVHWDLPPMQGHASPSWEAWCDYGAMSKYFDSCVIMSYAFSWAGSSPAPIGPKWWMDATYNYAVTVIPRNKLYLGIGGFGFRWDITKLQTQYQDGTYDSYRGASGGMWAWLDWMEGNLTHTDGLGSRPDTHTQPRIPFASFYDEESRCPYMYLHIYDYLYAWDRDENVLGSNIAFAKHQGKEYATTYSKQQAHPAELFPDGVISRTTLTRSMTTGAWSTAVNANNQPIGVTTKTPAVEVKPSVDGMCPGIVGEEQGVLTYTFSTSSPADVVLYGLFPFFGKDTLVGTLDGTPINPDFKWWDQGRLSFRHFRIGRVGAGTHTLIIRGPNGSGGGSSSGFQLRDIVLAPTFTNKFVNGGLRYTSLLRPFVGRMEGDAPGTAKDVYPHQNKFTVVAEALRREPDYMAIWPDDWRYDSSWANFAPYWKVFRDGTDVVSTRPLANTPTQPCNVHNGRTVAVYDHDTVFSRFETGALVTRTGVEAIAYLNGLDASEPHVRAQFSLYSAAGNLGILVGTRSKSDHWMVQFFTASSFGGLTGRVRLFRRNGGSYTPVNITAHNSAHQVDATTVACDLTSKLKTTCEVRVRNGIIKAYRGNTDSLGTGGVTSLFSYDAGITGGSVGFRTSNSAVEINLFQLGHANRYNPREKYDIVVKNQQGRVMLESKDVGLMERSNVVYDDPVYGTFRIVGEYEEYQTRRVSISKEWDYFQSEDVQLPPGDYDVMYRAQDIGVWFSYAFMCDSDGASIVYYNDNSTLVYYANKAKYEWGVAGIGYWVFGNEDDSLYRQLPSHAQ